MRRDVRTRSDASEVLEDGERDAPPDSIRTMSEVGPHDVERRHDEEVGAPRDVDLDPRAEAEEPLPRILAAEEGRRLRCVDGEVRTDRPGHVRVRPLGEVPVAARPVVSDAHAQLEPEGPVGVRTAHAPVELGERTELRITGHRMPGKEHGAHEEGPMDTPLTVEPETERARPILDRRVDVREELTRPIPRLLRMRRTGNRESRHQTHHEKERPSHM